MRRRRACHRYCSYLITPKAGCRGHRAGKGRIMKTMAADRRQRSKKRRRHTAPPLKSDLYFFIFKMVLHLVKKTAAALVILVFHRRFKGAQRLFLPPFGVGPSYHAAQQIVNFCCPIRGAAFYFFTSSQNSGFVSGDQVLVSILLRQVLPPAVQQSPLA